MHPLVAVLDREAAEREKRVTDALAALKLRLEGRKHGETVAPR